MNKDLEEKYISVIEHNVNVGKSSVGTEFIILVSGIVAICFFIYLFADAIGSFFIDRMSDKSQVKIERAFSFGSKPVVSETNNNVKKLESIRDKIIPLDEKLQGKSEFPIYEIPQKDINAFIIPDGTIFFTKGLLEEVKDEEMLAFVLAHELGHYAHRDHLKSISRQIIVSAILSAFSSGSKDISITLNSLSDLNGLTYSRKQEKEADKYANEMVYKLYGQNRGAVEFFRLLEKKDKTPEYLQYFSSHPATKLRLKLIQESR